MPSARGIIVTVRGLTNDMCLYVRYVCCVLQQLKESAS